MNKLFVTLILMFTNPSFAAKAKDMFEVQFSQNTKSHSYTLQRQIEKNKSVYNLKFENEKLKTKNIKLNSTRSELLMSEVNQLVLNEKNKKLKKLKKCTQYAYIKTTLLNLSVCKQNTALVGRTYSLLNQLRTLVNTK